MQRTLRRASNALSLFALLAAILFTATPEAAAQDADTPTVPLIEDGRAQVIPAFDNPEEWIRHHLWVETEFDTDGDGQRDRVHVDVTRPAQTESGDLKLPVIYETSPYYSGVAGLVDSIFWDVRHEIGERPPERAHPAPIRHRSDQEMISSSHVETWVPRGFVVVHSSSPGTGRSEGSPTVGGENESLAPKAVIDWLNGRARGFTTREGDEQVEAFWASGKVGMTGTSYNGTLPLAAATTGVEGLEVIIPVAPNTSYYHYYRSHGLVRHPGGYLGEDIDVLYDFIHSGFPESRAYADSVYRDSIMAQNQDRITGDYNDFWAGRDYLNEMENMTAALLMSHGFNDWNVMPEHSYRIYRKAREMGLPAQIYYHQGGHGGSPPTPMMNRWFTRYLFGVENGVENETDKAHIVREGDDRENPTAYADFPNPAASPVTLRLTAGAPRQGGLTLDAPGPQGRETLTDNYSFSGEALAKAEYTDHRLIYLTPELTDSVHISGVPSLTIRMASDEEAVNLTAWLVALPWQEGRNTQIYDNIITRGWADPQNRGNLRESADLIPGEFYEFSFELQPDDQVIPAGQRIALLIFSSDRDFTLWPEPGTRLTVDLDGTSLTLPVVGGEEAFSGW
ncbi:MAG: Xaa-Pro dipeptidyl-peptidase [Balneolaceae bacterium]|nr:Xaa-Pro dipeptidyl-peptidase [Balneolaceae bacterium]